MRTMKNFALLIAALFVSCTLPLAAFAQAPVQDRFPGPDDGKPPAQAPAPATAKPAKTAKPAAAATPTTAAKPAEGEHAKHAAASTATPARTVSCKDAFAKDSSHIKLATLFGSQNVAWDDVDGPEGSRLKATVVFPNDPKRRLEVMWTQPDARTDTQVIAINGQSTWGAPKGLTLGMALAAVEKLNGKPFRLNGFGKDGGTVQSWEGGALSDLPGGCKMSLRFAPDQKASPEVLKDVAVDKTFGSNDAAMKKTAPKVVE